MFLYEKNGKLNFQFGSGQLPTPTPTLELDKKELRIGSTIIPESGEIVTKAVKMADKYFDTIQDAIDNAELGAVITLLTNLESEKCEIGVDQEVVIDLNGYKLTNKGDVHTIVNKGKVTVLDNSNTGKGEVDNTAHEHAAFYNDIDAIATLIGCTFNRSQDKGTSSSANGNSWYTLFNQGTLTLSGDIKVLQNNAGYSSLIENGWYDGTKNTEKKVSKLIINSGEFINGKNTVKNDDFGVMVINGGKFTNAGDGAVVLTYNEATINGGEFIASGNTTGVIGGGYINDESDKGVVVINGGIFKANNPTKNLFSVGSGVVNGGSITINGGTFYGNVGKTLPYDVINNGGKIIG